MTMAPDGYPRFSVQWFKSSGPLEHNLRAPQLLKTYVVEPLRGRWLIHYHPTLHKIR